MLYRPGSFEPLSGERWAEARVRAALGRIVETTDAAFDPVELWPAHEWDAHNTPTPLEGLYMGAAGVLWALAELRERELAETRIDLAAAACRAVEAWRREPDFMQGSELPSRKESGFFVGESGILMVAWRLTGDDSFADALHARVRENVDNEAEEVMWGAPGTLVAARWMLEWTGEDRLSSPRASTSNRSSCSRGPAWSGTRGRRRWTRATGFATERPGTAMRC